MKMRKIALLIVALSLGAAWGQAPLSAAASEALHKGQAAASEAMSTYVKQTPDRPLWRQAIVYGQKARQLAPDSPAPMRFLAQVYSITNWYSRAYQSWDAYFKAGGESDAQVTQEFAKAAQQMGYASYNAGNLSAALTYYQKAHDLEPGDLEAIVWLARVNFESGKPKAALPLWQAAVKQAPDNQGYQYYLTRTQDQVHYGVAASNAFYAGVAAYGKEDKQAALADFEKAAKLNTHYKEAWARAASTSLELSLPQKAVSYWQGVLAIDPSDEGAQYFLGIAQTQARWGIAAANAFQDGYNAYNAGRLAKAETDFTKATQLNGGYADAWAWLGRIHYEQGDYAAAAGFYGQAARLEPANTTYQQFAQQAQTLAGTAPSGGAPEVAKTPSKQAEAAPPKQQAQTPTSPPEKTSPEKAKNPPPPERKPATTRAKPQPAPASKPPPTSPSPPSTQAKAKPESPAPSAAPAPKAAVTRHQPGKPVVLLNVTYTHQASADGAQGGAFSFFSSPKSLDASLIAPVNYAAGTLYQRVQVLRKPSSDPVEYQLCLVPDENISVEPACSNQSALKFTKPGVYTHSQSMRSLQRYSSIDWASGLLRLMLVIKDGQGNPIDPNYPFKGAWKGSPDLSLYYPMKVHYTAILVPPGASFPGWP